MSKKLKLAQVIALEKEEKAASTRKATEIYHTSQKPELFNGLTRV